MEFIRNRLDRLCILKRQRPQFSEIFSFYEELFRFLDAQNESFLTVVPGVDNNRLKRQEGFPLLDGDSVQTDARRAATFLDRLIDFLHSHGQQGKEDLDALRSALAAGNFDLAGIFRACLERDRPTLQTVAEGTEAPAALLEYVFDTALSFALQRAREEGLGTGSGDWPHGYCPLCGGLPAMGELAGEEGRMVLHCATCGEAWQVPRLRCAACGNQEVESLEYFTAEGENGYRVNVCRKCSCYLKVVDSRQAGTGLPMDVEDIGTLHLDLLAQKEGFTRGKKDAA